MPAASPSDIEREITIAPELDVICVRSVARDMARGLGFSRPRQCEIAIAVSELAGNILKFAGSGTVRIGTLDGGRPGIRVMALDNGPGIADIDKALEDGYSEGRHLGPRTLAPSVGAWVQVCP